METSTCSTEDHYAVLKYLRNSLLDAERRDIDTKYFKQATEITFSDIRKGEINPSIAKKLIEEYESASDEQQKNQEQKGIEGDEDDKLSLTCQVLICPFRRLPKNKKKNNDTQDPLIPLWIPATLHKEGALGPSSKLFPWIEREYLFAGNSTSRQKKEQMLGSTSDEEEYLALNPVSEMDKEWDSYLEWGLNFIDHFTDHGHFEFSYSKKEITTFSLGGDQYILDNYAYIAPDPDTISGAAEAIIELYNELINKKEGIRLVTSFCDTNPGNTRKIIGEEDIRENLTAHLGQMKREFPLARSQRQALHHFTALQDGEILAINGPPGTGKTTLLQSVVANLVVEKALADGDPPVILASSANNQATTNIIDSFATDNNADDPLASRWLPKPVSSYGLYCPSGKKQQEAYEQGLLYTNLKGGGFPQQVETQDFVNRAKRIFQQKAENYFEKSFSNISEIRFYLLDRLKKMKQILKNGKNIFEERKKSEERLGAKTVESPDQIQEELITINAKIGILEEKKANTSRQLKDLQSIKNKWEISYQKLPFYTRWLGTIISRFKKQIKIHNQFFFENHSLSPDSSVLVSYDSVLSYFSKTIDKLRDERDNTVSNLTKVENYKNLLTRINQWFEEHITVPKSSFNKRKLSLLDTQLRYKMFLYAIHYWECRWLAEAQVFVQIDEVHSQKNTEKQWLRYAKLTPCFVSTFYMLSKYFGHYQNDKNNPLTKFADLLIVDEAGQVPSEIGGANFSLAKKALVVGDTKQIQPIWRVSKEIDKENAAKSIPSKTPNYQELKQKGITANGGSIMKAAQQQTPFQLDHIEDRGMFLSEHWRCVPEIIDYCNTLVYKGKLKPQLQSDQPYHLPRIGFAHISGKSQTDNSASRYNEKEAEVIARWVRDNKDELIEQSEESDIENIVAVVTPFKKQSTEIKKILKKENVGLGNITVGTVHSLQGAEREVVIFSSVYDRYDSGTYFFDCDVMMLNVAVSRAKKSFLVFGDMHIFDPTNDQDPSGVLASYLFDDPDNELVDLKPPQTIGRVLASTDNGQIAVERIAKLQRHQNLLRYCLSSAQEQVIIASPFITEYAVTSDNIPQLIEEAVSRGVQVICYVDAYLNTSNSTIRPSARKGMTLLKKAGATLIIAENFHNKTLCADNHLISEGSFNWLSAQRNRTDKYHRYERSLVYWDENKTENETIKELIATFKGDMEERKLTVL